MFRLPADDEFLTEAETATLLGLKLSLLRSYRRRLLIGSVVIGRGIWHSGAHIRKYVESCETNAQDSPQTGCTGSASDPAATHGTGHGSIPDHVRHAASALARQTFAPQGKGSRSGGLKTAA